MMNGQWWPGRTGRITSVQSDQLPHAGDSFKHAERSKNESLVGGWATPLKNMFQTTNQIMVFSFAGSWTSQKKKSFLIRRDF